jgi:hypothetical protein
MEADVHARAEKIEHIKRVAQDPANLEGPATFPGAPALVSDRRSDRTERPDEVIQRMRSNPWRDNDGPLAHRVESSAGLAARAHTAIEGQSERLTHDGAEKLAGLLSPRPSTFGPYELRTAEDIARSAELVLALSNPHYESAFRHILKAPMEFRGGTGMLRWNDEERQAYVDVVACRAALIENTGTGGAYPAPPVSRSVDHAHERWGGFPVAPGVPGSPDHQQHLERRHVGRGDRWMAG